MDFNLPCVSKHTKVLAETAVQETCIDLMLWPDNHDCKQRLLYFVSLQFLCMSR